jgi:hypothetical protein
MEAVRAGDVERLESLRLMCVSRVVEIDRLSPSKPRRKQVRRVLLTGGG